MAPDWYNDTDSSDAPPDGLHIARLDQIKERDSERPWLVLEWSTNEREWAALYALDVPYPKKKAAEALEGLGIPRETLKLSSGDPAYIGAIDSVEGQLFEVRIQRRVENGRTWTDTLVEGPAAGRQEQLVPEAVARPAAPGPEIDAEIPF